MKSDSTKNARTVILIHGLWMRGWELGPLSLRLRSGGFAVHRFSYSSIRSGLVENGARLAAFVRELGSACHLVGHSLGGIVIHEALRQLGPASPVHRVVALASPFRGSRVAAWSVSRRSTAWSLGETMTDWQRGAHLEKWPHAVPLGIVCGKHQIGFGTLLGLLAVPSDGLVAHDESYLAGCADHVVVASNHAGLILSPAVARFVIRFLETGAFSALPAA